MCWARPRRPSAAMFPVGTRPQLAGPLADRPARACSTGRPPVRTTSCPWPGPSSAPRSRAGPRTSSPAGSTAPGCPRAWPSTPTSGGRWWRAWPGSAGWTRAGIDAELTRDNSITGAEQAAGARAARPDPAAKAEAWRLAVEEDSIPNGTQGWICSALLGPGPGRDPGAVHRPLLPGGRGHLGRSRASGRTRASRCARTCCGTLFPWPTDLVGVPPPARRLAGDRRPQQLDPSG